MPTPAPAQARIETWRVINGEAEKQIDDISQDVIDEMEIVHSLLPMGISGIETLRLLNTDGAFSDAIQEGDFVMVYLWREGEAENLRFTGKIVKTVYEGDFSSNEHYLNLICEDRGQELLAPPELPVKEFVGATGKEILDYLVGLCDTIILDSVDNGSGMVSIHDTEINETSLYDALVDLLEKAQTSSGAIGFDAYIDPYAKLHVFPRGTKTSSISLTDRIYSYQKTADIHPVRNKIIVYGKEEETLPLPKDKWCEQEGSESPVDKGWWSDTGATLAWDTTKPFFGNNSFRAYKTGYGLMSLEFKQTFPNITSVNCERWRRDAYKTLSFYIRFGLDYYVYVNIEELVKAYIRLFAPDANNAITAYLYRHDGTKMFERKAVWSQIELPLDKIKDIPNETWQMKIGNPDLSNVQAVQFYFEAETKRSYQLPFCFSVNIDGFNFAQKSFSYTAEDLESQQLYGVRCAKPIVDPNLTSTAECEKRAKQELAALKDKAVMLEQLTCEGDYFTQGYKQYVSIPQDNIDGYFLISEVRDIVKYTTWNSRLTFTKQL